MMSSENPYQSPESSSTPEPSGEASDRVHTRYPTWRFWALALFGALTVFVLLLFQSNFEYGERTGYRTPKSLLAMRITTTVAAISWAVSSIAILITWRSPARVGGSLPRTTSITALSSAIVLLGTLDCLAVAAFFIALFLPSLNQKDGARAITGLALGVFSLSICAIVARDLWLDAMGRTKKIARDA